MCREDGCNDAEDSDSDAVDPTPPGPAPTPIAPQCPESVCTDDANSDEPCIRGYVAITGHNDKFYEGDYFYESHWNCQPHFVSNEGAHLYFYVGIDSAKWALDDRDQSGDHAGQYDYHRGGWIESISLYTDEVSYMWDLNMNAWLYDHEQYIQLKMKDEDDGEAGTFVRVEGHPEDRYLGEYYRDGFWNAKPHFINRHGSHLYYYNSIGHSSLGYWQFDDRDQWENYYPGNSDWYDGGWFTSPSGSFNYNEDLDGEVYLYHEQEGTIYLELNEAGSGGGSWWPWWEEETVDPQEDTSVIYDYEFDPDSIYRSDGVPVLNGQPIYTLNQLYD